MRNIVLLVLALLAVGGCAAHQKVAVVDELGRPAGYVLVDRAPGAEYAGLLVRRGTR